jgi:hypothetical protein
MGEIDNDVLFMVNTTVKYLVEGVRASEAPPRPRQICLEIRRSSSRT